MSTEVSELSYLKKLAMASLFTSGEDEMPVLERLKGMGDYYFHRIKNRVSALALDDPEETEQAISQIAFTFVDFYVGAYAAAAGKMPTMEGEGDLGELLKEVDALFDMRGSRDVDKFREHFNGAHTAYWKVMEHLQPGISAEVEL